MNSSAQNGQVYMGGCVRACDPKPRPTGFTSVCPVVWNGLLMTVLLLLLLWLRSISPSEIPALTSMSRAFKVKLLQRDLGTGRWWVLSKQTHSRTHWPHDGPRFKIHLFLFCLNPMVNECVNQWESSWFCRVRCVTGSAYFSLILKHYSCSKM